MTKEELIARYPTGRDALEIDRRLQDALARNTDKIIVLDDDSTGTQTVHGVRVYTGWDMESVRAGMESGDRMFYILTNSRSFSADKTVAAHREIAENILAVSGRFLLVSRSDSTLRGHYPLETEALRAAIEERGGQPFDGEIICPFFPEGGRVTAGNIHYVDCGGELVPAGETEFAQDKTFGYKSSDLTLWVEEKTLGRYPAGSVTVIGLDELRLPDYDAIERKLDAVSEFGKVVVNALCYDDLKVFATALYAVIERGKRFMVRSAAALVKVLGGIPDKPLLESSELFDPGNSNGGLIITGSHVQKTTAQLESLRGRGDVMFIELNQHLALDPEAFEEDARRVTRLAGDAISAGLTTVVQTRRERFDIATGDKEDELLLAIRISDKLTSVVTRLPVKPSFVIAKGGLTSSDVVTKGLGVKSALVLGQLLPGVPVWKIGEESRFSGMPYVVFPGNVGDDGALLAAVEKCCLH